MALFFVERALHEVQRLVRPEAEESPEDEGHAHHVEEDARTDRDDPERDDQLAPSGIQNEDRRLAPDCLHYLVGCKDSDDQGQCIAC